MPRNRPIRALVVGVVTLLVVPLLLAGCGGQARTLRSHPGASGEHGSGHPARLSGHVTVLAAASLTEAFGRLGRDFEHAHPGVRITFSFGASSTLAEQIRQGIPADVFASADTRVMQQVAGRIAGRPTVFVRNRLEIAVPPGDPGHVHGIRDFARPGLRLAACAPEVPCGTAAKQVFRLAGVHARLDTLEQDVKAVLTKVSSGEVDAGLVYRTDVRAARADVDGIDFPEAARAINDYPIGRLDHAPNPRAARAFVRYVLSAHGKRVLTAAGFEQP